MCLKASKMHADPDYFLSARGLQWVLNVDVLLMIETGIRGGMCHDVYKQAKAKHKSMKDYDPSAESWYQMYLEGYVTDISIDGFDC